MSEVWGFLKDIETEYNCGGICYTPLFGITTDISEGSPTTECLDQIFDKTFSAAGGISGAGAFFLFLTFFASLSLCGGMPTSMEQEAADATVSKAPDN